MDPKHDDNIRINFNITLPNLSCQFATVDVVNSLGAEQFNITQNIKKYKVDEKGWTQEIIEEAEEHPHYQEMDVTADSNEFSKKISLDNFIEFVQSNKYTLMEFYAPWCHWCQKLAPVWEATAKALQDKPYSQFVKMGKVDCTDPSSQPLCISNHVQAFPTIIFYRQKTHSHEFYKGDRTVDSFIKYMEDKIGNEKLNEMKESVEKSKHVIGEDANMKDLYSIAPQDGCRLVGYLDVKRTPGNFHISAHSSGYTFDASYLNITHLVHQITFGDQLTNEEYDLLPKESQDYINTLHASYAIQKEKYQTLQHYLKVVSTDYYKYNGQIIHTYQYTAT